MAYCTITDVNSYVPQQPFTSTSVPSQAQVEAFIVQVANQINMTLANLGYATPVVSGTVALAEIRKANAWGALGLAQQSRMTAVAPDQALGLSAWWKMFAAWIEALADPKNPYELSDAPRTGSEVIKPIGELLRDPQSGSIDTGTSADPANYLSSPTFSIGMKF